MSTNGSHIAIDPNDESRHDDMTAMGRSPEQQTPDEREGRVKVPRRAGRPKARPPIRRPASTEMKTMTTEEVGDLMKVTPKTIRDRWKKQRDFPQPMKIGRNLLFREHEVLAYMERHNVARYAGDNSSSR